MRTPSKDKCILAMVLPHFYCASPLTYILSTHRLQHKSPPPVNLEDSVFSLPHLFFKTLLYTERKILVKYFLFHKWGRIPLLLWSDSVKWLANCCFLWKDDSKLRKQKGWIWKNALSWSIPASLSFSSTLSTLAWLSLFIKVAKYSP